MAAKATIPDLKQFLESKDSQRGQTAAPAAAQGKVPDLAQFLAQKDASRGAASPASVGDLQKKFSSNNTQPPSNLSKWAHADPVEDYLFGKGQRPVEEMLRGKKPPPPESNAGPMLREFDHGVVGKAWDKVRLLPTGTGKNVGELEESILNPIGQTDAQQAFAADEADLAYKKQTEGLGTAGKVAASTGRGVGDFFVGQVSASNLALLFAGPARAVAGVEAEASSAMTRQLGKLAQRGFIAQMSLGLKDSTESSYQAFKAGDYETGIRMAVSGLVSASMVGMGVHDEVAQHRVEALLNKQSTQTYGKKFDNLTPQQKAQTVYEASRTMPLDTKQQAAAVDNLVERAKRAGLPNAPATASRDARLEEASRNGVRPMAPLPQLSPEESAAARSRMEEVRTQARDDNFADKVNREMSAIPTPEKRGYEEPATVLNVPSYSPAERESIREETAKATAWRTIEAERAADQARAAEAAQREADVRNRAMDTEQEEAARAVREGEAYRVNDPRSDVRKQILDELGTRAETSEAGRLYNDHIAALNRQTEGMGFRDTEMAASMIRAKRQRGGVLSDEENSVLSMQAKRDEILRRMAEGNPRAEQILADHDAFLDAESIKSVMDFAHRESGLREAAEAIDQQARISPDPDTTDMFARQAVEAREMAEKVTTQRDLAIAEHVARSEPQQVVPRGPDTPREQGRDTTIQMPDGRELPAHYAAMRLSQLTLSHDPFSFEWNPKYEPRRLQPRDLQTNRNAQGAIITDSSPENYRLSRYVTDNPTGLEGPAVVLPDGRVAGGNSRLARLTRRLREADGHTVASDIHAGLGRFGIDGTDLLDTNDPYIPVRVLKDVPETTRDLIQLGQDLNRDTIMGFSPEEQGAMNADLLTQDDIDSVSTMLDSIPGEPSLRDTLRLRGDQIMDLMVNRGIIPANKRAEYMAGGELTDKAKSAFEAAILSKAIDDPVLLATTSASLVGKIERALPSLMRLKSAGGQWDVSDYLKDSLRTWKQIDSIRPSLNLLGSPEDSIVDKFFHPERFSMGSGMISFDEGPVRPEPHPVTYALVKVLDAKAIDVKRAFSAYADQAEGRQSFLLAPPDPYEVFNETLGKLAGEQIHPADWATMEPASPEQRAEVDELRSPKPKPTREEREIAREMTTPPNVSIAAEQIVKAAQEGAVTPESLRSLFAEHAPTAEHADLLVDVLGRIVPNATGMPLDRFLLEKLSGVEVGGDGAGNHGVTDFLDDGRALIHLYEGANASTVLHEFTHVMRRFLVDDEDKAALERFAGVEDEIWSRGAEEKVARGFEKYMSDGAAPTEELQPLFAKLKRVFRDIYQVIRNGKWRLPKTSEINIRLSKEAREVFDRWFTGSLDMAPPPASGGEAAAAMPTLEMGLTPVERETAKLWSNGGNPIADRMSESRIKRFRSAEDADAWVINNHANLHGVEVWQLPDGPAFAQFIPKDAKRLFQEESYGDMIRKLGNLRQYLPFEKNPERVARMRAEIQRLEGKTGVTGEMMMGAAPEPLGIIGAEPPRMTPPPDLRPNPEPGQVKLLFGGDENARTDRPRSVPDAAAGVQDRGATGGVAERSERTADVAATGGAGGGGADRGGRGAGTAGSDRQSLRNVRAAELASPERVRGAATVEPAKWAARMKDLRMPEALPAPTVKLDSDITALLKFPGQAEVVESTLSALEQYDGAIIATPTGTGKTYTVLGAVKQMQRRGQADRVLVITKNDSIINGEVSGFKDVAKNTFALDVKDLPRDLKKVEDGIYALTYSTLRNRPDIARQTWDLVMYDEAAEAQNWQESSQGKAVVKLNEVAKKAVYVSATSHSTAIELGYMSKLGLWKQGEFAQWAKQFGVREGADGKLTGGNEPKMLLKLREQLVERGQFVTQDKSLDGFSATFAQVPLTGDQHETMKNCMTAMKQAALYYDTRGNAAMAKAVRGNMATFVKSYLERVRLPQTIEVAKQMRAQGWDVLIFSETRSKVDQMYDFLKEADNASEGRLTAAMPKLPGVYEELAKAFGDDAVANFSGQYSPAREAEKKAFDEGQKRILFATYGAGGVGVSLHDTVGNRPRAAIYLGPPWSGKMLDQAMGRPWRYNVKSNVYSVFMTSNAMPETSMILNKVAPRLESLRAAVNGVSNDPMVERMRSLGYNREDLAKYEMGGAPAVNLDEMMQLDHRVLLNNYKDIRVPSAEGAKNKGMKYPGGEIQKTGVVRLFQADGTMAVPDRFQTPEQRKGTALNEEIAQAVADGKRVPGAGDALKDLDPGVRQQIADQIGPQVQELLDQGGQSEPSAAARIAWQNELTKIQAAKAAGDITVNTDADGPAWNMRTNGGTPEGLAAPADVAPPPVPNEVRPALWLLSGRQNLLRVASQAGVPEVGYKLKYMRDDYQARRANVAGEFQSRLLKTLTENGITPKEDRLVFLVKEGKLPAPNERIAKAAEELTKMTLDAQHMLADRGWKGNYFEDGEAREYNFGEMSDDPRYAPHKHDPNEKITLTNASTGESQVFNLKDLLGKSLSETKREGIMAAIEENTGMKRAEIEDFLDRKRRRTPLAGNLERARQADLPFYRMDRGVWMEYFEQLGEAVARADVFGQGREKLDAVVVQIPSVKGRAVVQQIYDGLLAKLPWDQEMGKWYSRWGTAQVLSKMTFSSVKVPFHLAHTAVVMENIGSVAKGIFEGVTNYTEAKERAILSGVLVDQMKAGAMMEQAAGAKAANAMLKYEGFHWAYKFDRIVANAAAQNWMERYALPKLQRGARNADHIRTQLKEKFLISDKDIDAAVERGRWNQEDLNRGGAALTNRTLFTTDSTELPPAWRARSKEPVSDNLGAVVRVATILKGFTFKTAMIIKEDIIDEARRGNYRPLTYAMMTYPIVGEALRATAAAARSIPSVVTGNVQNSAAAKYEKEIEDLVTDPTAGKLLHRYIDDLAHATALTMVSEVIDTFAFPSANKRAARFKEKQLWENELNWMIGPYADVLKSVRSAYDVLGALTVEDGEKKFTKAAKASEDWAEEEFPALRSIFPKKPKNAPVPPPE